MNDQEPTRIEQLAAWTIHRKAAAVVRKHGGHFFCSQAVGFMAAARQGEELNPELGKPCERCLSIWKAEERKVTHGEQQ
jgi:hypothetical protein